MIYSHAKKAAHLDLIFWLEQHKYYLKRENDEMVKLTAELVDKFRKKIENNTFTTEEEEFWERQAKIDENWDKIYHNNE
jgi:hypothetical protein